MPRPGYTTTCMKKSTIEKLKKLKNEFHVSSYDEVIEKLVRIYEIASKFASELEKAKKKK